ncbi:MAG: hypothetical protein EAZ95_12335, partial [Bacteroidetes bacterium]
APNWNEYFVQKEVLRVGYLQPADTELLINAYPALTYETEVRQRLYEQTQGHPAMLQIVLHKIVETANLTRKTHIDLPDLEKALSETLYQQDNNVVDIFWTQFCKNRGLRPAVLELLAGKTPTDEKALFQLTEHEFVIEREGKFVFRVPLFETWLRKYSKFVD